MNGRVREFLRSRTRIVVVAGMAVIVAVSLVGFEIARAQTGATVYYACLSGGKLYNVTENTAPTCKSSETLIQWNQQGPQGPQGEQGQVGPQGPQGVPGTNGYEVIKVTRPVLAQNNPYVVVDCPTDKQAVGVGYYGNIQRYDPPHDPLPLVASIPVGNDNQLGSGWTLMWLGTAIPGYNIDVYLICIAAP